MSRLQKTRSVDKVCPHSHGRVTTSCDYGSGTVMEQAAAAWSTTEPRVLIDDDEFENPRKCPLCFLKVPITFSVIYWLLCPIIV